MTVVFWNAVVTDLTMPTFSPTMLGLLGISGGTFLGFKLSEDKK
jgi:hypothetical protein